MKSVILSFILTMAINEAYGQTLNDVFALEAVSEEVVEVCGDAPLAVCVADEDMTAFCAAAKILSHPGQDVFAVLAPNAHRLSLAVCDP